MCASGERTSYHRRFARLSEEAAFKAKAERSKQTYTLNSGQIVNAQENSESVADRRVSDFDAYTEMTGKPKPSLRVMGAWLQGEKDAYKEAMGLAPRSKPKSGVVMEWLSAIRMDYEKAMSLPPNSKPETKDVMEWLKAKRMA